MIAKDLLQLSQIQHPTYIGGGTDIMPLLKNGVRKDTELVFLHQIADLKGLREESGGLYLGSGETLAQLAENPLVRTRFPALAQAAGATASPQIRNMATLGGNVMQDRRCIYFNQSAYWRSALPLCFKTGGTICHQIPRSPACRAIYYSDTAAALLVYEAQAEVLEGDKRKRLPVKELISRHIRANGLAWENHLPLLVLGFWLPNPPEGEHSGFYKYAMRAAIDFPLINFALRCGGGRAALAAAGAVAPEPVILSQTAALLDRPAAEDDDILECCKAELKKLAMPIKEACISPTRKRDLYAQFAALLPLRRA